MQPNVRKRDDNSGADLIQGHRAGEGAYLVRSPAVALDAPAGERAAWMEVPGAAQLLAQHAHPNAGTSILVTMNVGP